MKRSILLVLLALCLITLCACQSGQQQRYAVVTEAPQQNLYGTPAQEPAPASQEEAYDFDIGDYDPASESNEDDEVINITMVPAGDGNTPAPTKHSEYAGATPVIIDPIDKPTPTPLPPLTFTYEAYNASKLHLTFEGPSGWTVNDLSGDSFTITSNDASTGYQAFATIRVSSVNGTYNTSELKTEVRQVLQTIRSDMGLKNFSGSNTATRDMLGKTGVYANYSGTNADGIKIAGRVHIVNVNKSLYVLHVSYPQAYRDTYVDNVYHKIRNTLKAQ